MSIREFDTGATRDTDDGKLDFEGFLSPLALERYAQYMHKHRRQSDGGMRDSDNWQKGIPLDAYMKSGWRHFRDWWREHRGYPTDEGIEEALCALIFNASGYLHEHLKAQSVVIPPPPEYDPCDVAFSAKRDDLSTWIEPMHGFRIMPDGSRMPRHSDSDTPPSLATTGYAVPLGQPSITDYTFAHYTPTGKSRAFDGVTAETAYLARFGENES